MEGSWKRSLSFVCLGGESCRVVCFYYLCLGVVIVLLYKFRIWFLIGGFGIMFWFDLGLEGSS